MDVGEEIMDLSVLIPSRKEMFLKRTIEDVLENIKGDTEIIAILDGAWADPPIEDHPNVHLIYHSEAIGQRAAVNEAAKMSTAKYIMKLDAHCAVGPGFDVKLMENCEYDWTVVPRMYNLHAFDWVCECGHRIYQGPTPGVCEKCGGQMEKEMIWKPKPSPETDFMRFDSDLRFQYWSGYKKRPEAQGDICDLMSCLGACWFMYRQRFWDLEGLDEKHGSWGQMGTELACKSWLSGGRMVVNKKTWFSHLFRTRGGDFGFPYKIHGSDQEKARQYSRDLWLNDKWPKAVHPLSWLIERFAPVPDWELEEETTTDTMTTTDDLTRRYFPKQGEGEKKAMGDLGAVKLGARMALERYPGYDVVSRLRDGEGLEEVIATKLRALADWLEPRESLTEVETEELKSRLDSIPALYSFAPYMSESPVGKGIVFYTDNQVNLKIAHAVQKRLRKMGLPIVSASLKPMSHFGDRNIYLRGLKRGYLTMFKQILAGLEASEAEIIFFCEHDVLYHPSHFDFTPPRKDVFYYNTNVWKVRAEDGHALRVDDCKQTSGLCAYRSLLLEHYHKRIEIVERDGFTQRMGFEPGTHGREERVDDYGADGWESEYPNIDIRHGNNLTPSRWTKAEFRSQRYTEGWQESDSVPGWGNTKGFLGGLG